MRPVKARLTRALPHGANIPTCDNSGAKLLRVISVRYLHTVKRRPQSAGVGSFIVASVVKGKPDMRKQVVFACVVRQKKEYRRPDGTRIMFEDNAAVVLKDEQGNPKGTMIKGAIAKEAAERFPAVAKIASIIV